MIRQILKLAADAAKVEIDRWRNPGAEPEPIAVTPVAVLPEPEPSPAPVTRWSSTTQGHTQALASTSCPDCGVAKKVGAYRCAPCHQKATVLCGTAAKGEGT